MKTKTNKGEKMQKLGREIRIKFIYSEELLRKILDNPTNEHLYQMRDKFMKKETIKFNPFDKPEFEKELSTFSNNFTFYSYKDLAERLKEYERFTILQYRIFDNNNDSFKSKQYGLCWACDVTGINIQKSLERYIDLEKAKYEIVRTKPGAKHPVKKVFYWGKEI
jgi:hypothetical protein